MLAIDPSLHHLVPDNKISPTAQLGVAAQGFETLFLEQVMGSMRQATAGFGEHNLQESQQTLMMRQMLDAQLAQMSAASGTGLAEIIVDQLSGRTETMSTAALGVNRHHVDQGEHA